MLYLNPPFYMVNGVSFFPDHVDPLQFYYLPMAPHLTMTTVGGVQQPSLLLVKYTGDSTSGGFLNFDVNLGLTANLDELASQLKEAAHLSAVPHLTAIPVIDGTVKVMLLDYMTPDPTAKPATSTAAPSNGFVIKAESAGKPTLYGDEQATFSIQLDPRGATIVEQTLDTNISMVAVIYSLDFLALRPGYQVKVTVDWNRVQHHLDDSFSANVLFFSSSIDKEIDKLVENQTIKIEATTEVDEADPANKDFLARRDMAMAQARDMVKSTFFTSSIPPPVAGGPDDIDKATRVANTVGQLVATGGMSAMASFSYKKVDITRIDQKALNATFEERTTVRQTIFPQGHLGGMFRVAGGAKPADVIKSVKVDDVYFAKRTIQVISRADFAHDGIQSIDVSVQYGAGQPQNVLLEPTTPNGRGTVSWTSQLTPAGAMLRDAPYSYRVTFKDADRSQRPVSLDTAALGLKLSTADDILEISPRDLLYGLSDAPVNAMEGFPWDRYPLVEVSCRYVDAANNVDQEQTYRLTKEATSGTFQLFMRDPSKRAFDFKVTYHGADGTDVATAWAPAEDEQVLVHDPYPKLLQLTVVPQIDWTTIDRVFVDLDYEPDDTEASFEFNATAPGAQTFKAHPADPTQKLVAYNVTILTKANTTITVPKSYTADKRLILRADMRGHRVIGVASDGKPFAAAHVVSIDVDLRYLDPTAGLSFSDSFTFKTPSDHASFEYDFVDTSKTRYDYKTTAHYDNGLTKATDWTSANDTTLTVPVG